MKITGDLTPKKIFGFILIILGIAGLILPFLPGWILIFVGLEIVGINLVFFDRIKAYVKDKIEKERGKNG